MLISMSSTAIFANLKREVFDTANPSPYTEGVQRGLNEDLIRRISNDKNEPEWMLKHRLESFRIFQEKPLPLWGPDLSHLDLNDIIYYSPQRAV